MVGLKWGFQVFGLDSRLGRPTPHPHPQKLIYFHEILNVSFDGGRWNFINVDSRNTGNHLKFIEMQSRGQKNE